MTSMRARAIDVAAAAFREAGVRAPRTQASTAVDALLAAGLLHDPTPAPAPTCPTPGYDGPPVAGRIARSSIDAVRERADIVELVQARTGPVRRTGGRAMARCPFHDERTPSFSIDPAAKLYHCFGCGESGDVFTLVMKLEGLPFEDAVESLADRYGIELAAAVLSLANKLQEQT